MKDNREDELTCLIYVIFALLGLGAIAFWYFAFSHDVIGLLWGIIVFLFKAIWFVLKAIWFVLKTIYEKRYYIMALFALWGMGESIFHTVRLSCKHIRHRETIEENSHVGYFISDGFSNVLHIISEIWPKNFSALNIKDDMGCFLGALRYISWPFQAAGVLAASLFCTWLLFVVYFAIALPILLFSLLLSTLIKVLDWLLDKRHHLTDICPHCHRRVDLPTYICSDCGREHKHLTPSVKFGPLFRKCQCGRRLPASRLLGRDKLRTVCPSCKRTLLGPVHKPFTIALIGGPSAGKSQLVLKLLATLSRNKSAVTGYEVSKNSIEYCLRKILVMVLVALGQKKMKQDDSKKNLRDVDALCLDLSHEGGGNRSRLYVCDPPGEAFESAETLSSHRYYANMDFALLVIDPLSLPAIRKRSAENAKPVTSSIISPEDCFNRWLICMNKNFHGIAGKVKCAVVLSKCDKLASVGITNIRAGASEGECKEFLREYAGDNMVRLIENTFASVNFFAVSAIDGDGSVGQVAAWLLGVLG